MAEGGDGGFDRTATDNSPGRVQPDDARTTKPGDASSAQPDDARANTALSDDTARANTARSDDSAAHSDGARATEITLPELQLASREAYAITAEIGRGGLGRVVRARDPMFGRTI